MAAFHEIAFRVLAQGRGEDLDDGSGVVVIVLVIGAVALTLAAIAFALIRRSRQVPVRGGPDDEPHEPGRAGRVRPGMKPRPPRR